MNLVHYEAQAREYGRRLFLERANAEPWKKDDSGFQSKNDFCNVKVRAGWSRDLECPTTECIIYVHGIRDKHYHLVIDENGRELISEWRQNSH